MANPTQPRYQPRSGPQDILMGTSTPLVLTGVLLEPLNDFQGPSPVVKLDIPGMRLVVSRELPWSLFWAAGMNAAKYSGPRRHIMIAAMPKITASILRPGWRMMRTDPAKRSMVVTVASMSMTCVVLKTLFVAVLFFIFSLSHDVEHVWEMAMPMKSMATVALTPSKSYFESTTTEADVPSPESMDMSIFSKYQGVARDMQIMTTATMARTIAARGRLGIFRRGDG